jgi:hypothetical protein
MKIKRFPRKTLVPRIVSYVTVATFLGGWIYSAVHIWRDGTAFFGFPLWFWRYGSACDTTAHCNFIATNAIIDVAITITVPAVFYKLLKWAFRNAV